MQFQVRLKMSGFSCERHFKLTTSVTSDLAKPNLNASFGLELRPSPTQFGNYAAVIVHQSNTVSGSSTVTDNKASGFLPFLMNL